MLSEDRTKITLRYCIIKGIVSYLMHISGDERIIKKDRKITQTVFFLIVAAFFAVAVTQFEENYIKIISASLCAFSLILSLVFFIVYKKEKPNYLFASDQIIDLEITESEITAVVNDEKRVIKLDGSVHFTQNSELYVIKDSYGGLFLPFRELEPNEKELTDLWFSKGFVYDEPALKGRERVPKMHF